MTTDLDQRIAARIAGRQLCETIVDMVAGEVRALAQSQGPEAAESFWQNFRTAFEGHFPAACARKEITAPMTDEECRRFGSLPMPQVFKKHAGARVDETPIDYLEYIDQDETRSFREQLNRYLRSDRVQREQDSP